MELRTLDPASPRADDDLAAVLALVRLVYGFEMTAEFYRWRFLANPFGAPLVTLLWDGDTLAGHYAASPTRAWWGTELAAAQSMTTMTHPDYRNRGVFTTLAADLYARMADRGVQLIWGMPNTQSHYGFRTKLGWRDVGMMFTMTRVLGAEPAANLDSLVGPAATVTELFHRPDDGRVFASMRDAAYLRWRYVDNPITTYRYFTLPGGAADVLIVAKDYALTPTTRALELVDYLYGRAPAVLGVALRGVLAWAAAHGFAMVRTWMAVGDPAFGELEKLGFAPREPLGYFGARTFGAFDLPAASWNRDGWYITMGDSDNY